MIGTLNAGATALMLSLGHRTGLFDCMADLPTASSSQIAAASGLDERYVREWLGAMVAAGIVEIDPTRGRYCLPNEHAACLTRASSPDNIAVFAQRIGLLGQVEDDILQCFQSGGGVPYERYGPFHEDKDHPIGPFLYTISCMHCMSVSLAQGGDGLSAM